MVARWRMAQAKWRGETWVVVRIAGSACVSEAESPQRHLSHTGSGQLTLRVHAALTTLVMALAIRFHPPTSPTLPVPPMGLSAERLHNGTAVGSNALPRFSFRYTQARLYALRPKFLRDLA
jgi:hypothetical protein